MTGYTKLFGSIVASTIWREPHGVRIVWITMLALANKGGVVEASLPGLADLARVKIEECKEALTALESPDEYSRTPDNQGRRIRAVDGGWEILNHAKYRAKMNADERREYLRLKQQESRNRRKGVNSESTNVNSGQETSTPSTHAEAEAKASVGAKAPPPRPSRGDARVKDEPSAEGLKFADWFRSTLDPDARPEPKWRANWARCYDEMVRIDQRPPPLIRKVCEWVRKDDFWSANCQSPLRLRKRKDGILYFDQFVEKMEREANKAKTSTQGAKYVQPAEDAEW